MSARAAGDGGSHRYPAAQCAASLTFGPSVQPRGDASIPGCPSPRTSATPSFPNPTTLSQWTSTPAGESLRVTREPWVSDRADVFGVRQLSLAMMGTTSLSISPNRLGQARCTLGRSPNCLRRVASCPTEDRRQSRLSLGNVQVKGYVRILCLMT